MSLESLPRLQSCPSVHPAISVPVQTSPDYRELGSIYYVVHKDRICFLFFAGGSVVKEFACNRGDATEVDSVPASGRPSGGRHGNPLQYSCL